MYYRPPDESGGLVNLASPALLLESRKFKRSDTTTPTKNAEGILILQDSDFNRRRSSYTFLYFLRHCFRSKTAILSQALDRAMLNKLIQDSNPN